MYRTSVPNSFILWSCSLVKTSISTCSFYELLVYPYFFFFFLRKWNPTYVYLVRKYSIYFPDLTHLNLIVYPVRFPFVRGFSSQSQLICLCCCYNWVMFIYTFCCVFYVFVCLDYYCNRFEYPLYFIFINLLAFRKKSKYFTNG